MARQGRKDRGLVERPKGSGILVGEVVSLRAGALVRTSREQEYGQGFL
jgi:hypothetical protein